MNLRMLGWDSLFMSCISFSRFARLLLSVFILRAITCPEALCRTLKTSEKNPDPIFSRVKSSKLVSLEKALIIARYEDDETLPTCTVFPSPPPPPSNSSRRSTRGGNPAIEFRLLRSIINNHFCIHQEAPRIISVQFYFCSRVTLRHN